jgi:hypothetical protein
MDFHKIIHDLSEAARQGHWPLFLGWLGALKYFSKDYNRYDLGDLGDTPGDNILPKEILSSLSSRREIPGRL